MSNEKVYTHSIKFYEKDTQKSDYVPGISMAKPPEWAPDFVVCELGINLPVFREWLGEQIQAGRITNDGWVNMSVSERKSQSNGRAPELTETSDFGI